MFLERAVSSVELIGITVTVMLILGGLVTGFKSGDVGSSTSRQIEEKLDSLLSGDVKKWEWHKEKQRSVGSNNSRLQTPNTRLKLGSWKPSAALISDSWHYPANFAGTKMQINATACALCATAQWSHSIGADAMKNLSETNHGLAAAISAGLRLALVSAEASVKAGRKLGSYGRINFQSRVRAMLGGESDVQAKLMLGPRGLALEGEAGAMAGGIARAEAAVGVNLLGVAIRQSGHVEGWAGAGIRGAVGGRIEDGQASWKLGWGGALGLGGAAEWSGHIDYSELSPAHRRLAKDVLITSMRVAGVPIPYIPSLLNGSH